MKAQNTFTYQITSLILSVMLGMMLFGQREHVPMFIFAAIGALVLVKECRTQIFKEIKIAVVSKHEVISKVTNGEPKQDFNLYEIGTNRGRLYDHTDTQYYRNKYRRGACL